jgi:hypothetical protein
MVIDTHGVTIANIESRSCRLLVNRLRVYEVTWSVRYLIVATGSRQVGHKVLARAESITVFEQPRKPNREDAQQHVQSARDSDLSGMVGGIPYQTSWRPPTVTQTLRRDLRCYAT